MSRRKRQVAKAPEWLGPGCVDAATLPKPTRCSTSLTAGPATGGRVGLWLGSEAIAMSLADAEALARHLLREVDLQRKWLAQRQPEVPS
jgi:hypothetical protein